ncbi:dTDP-4-dehydrorhamnose reductase [Pararhodobacter sp.]|uniref:dTDP-4-dehydrorhamnose reductase n=1 Tax=Pararhodobacter sp. TaxID=2127056 RepID=UPI002FDEEB96
MRVLVFGKTGQLATELRRALPGGVFLGRARADLADPAACAAAVRQHRPEAVINAAAYTAVDRAESEEALAAVINGDSPAAMARAAEEIGAVMIQPSTDYVFDGAGDAPFAPDHPTAPLNAYGRAKLAGEVGVRAAGGVHAILRVSWVFSAHGSNFVKTTLRLGATRDQLAVVADQIGGPTPADDIARACLTIARALRDAPAFSGTYHFAGAPDTSWAGFARETFARSGMGCAVTDIPTSDYPTPARRPLNSRLDCSGLDVFGLDRPDWRAGLDRVLQELKVKA